MVPKFMQPVFREIYRRLIEVYSKIKFSKKQYENVAALKCIVSYNKYGGYCVPESSRYRPAARKILSNDIHEPKTIEYIISKCGNGDVVHAGTYFGDFLPALSKGVSANSIIWAFEPNPENYRCAKITIEINNITNVVLTNAGLGAKQEQLFIQTIDKKGRALGGASRIVSHESNEMTLAENVQMITIDSIISLERFVSVIQLDVEGHEKNALTGALSTIQRCLPVIILEVLPSSTLIDSDWFRKNILCLGYRKIIDVHGNSVFACES